MLLTTFALSLTPVLFQAPKQKQAVKLQRILVEEESKAEVQDRPMLGVHLDVEEPIVRALMEGGPAAEAGFEPGDRITKVGKKKVKDTEGLLKAIAKHEAGEEVKFRVMRDIRAKRPGAIGESGVVGEHIVQERLDLKATLSSAESLSRREAPRRASRALVKVEGDHEPRPFVVMKDGSEEFSHSEEHVDFWESEDGSHKSLTIQMSGDQLSEARLQELLHEHGIDVQLGHVRVQGGDVDIRVEMESDGGAIFGGERMLEVLDLPSDEELDELEAGLKREMKRGRKRGESAEQPSEQAGRQREGRRGRRERAESQGEGRRGRRHQAEARDEGRRRGWRQGDRQGDERRMRWWQAQERNEGHQRSWGQNNFGGRGGWMRRNEGGYQGGDRWGRYDDRHHDDRHYDEGRHDDRHDDDRHHDDGRHDEQRHHEERMEEDFRDLEEISRGFEDAMRQMNEQRDDHARRLHEERERVIEELYQRIEEISRQFDDRLNELEEGHGEGIRRIEEERERLFREFEERAE